MSDNTDLRWLRPSKLKGAARRFGEFCKTDIKQQEKVDKDFDIDAYIAASKLIISKLQATNKPAQKDNAEC